MVLALLDGIQASSDGGQAFDLNSGHAKVVIA